MTNQKLSIKFLGATGTVTGSRYLLTHNNKRLLVDCGMFQGLKQLRLRNWEPFPVDPATIDAIVLTHAHLDHSGYLPRVYNQGFRGPVFATHATAALCNILLPDAAYLQKEDADFVNKQGVSKHTPALPLYTIEDAKNILKQFQGVDWNKETAVAGFAVKFNPESHLLGAGSIEIVAGYQKITFSGDLGRNHDPILPDRSWVTHTDYLVVESTYGDRLHPEGDVREELAQIINKTVSRNGTVLVPTFAIGRAQALIYLINKLKEQNRIPDVPLYLDSPMAITATKTHHDFAAELKMPRAQLEHALKDVIYTTKAQQSAEINKNRAPKIVLSSSGMLVGGRVLHHLKFLGQDSKNSIVLVGFQAAGTRGEALMRGKRELKIHGELVPIAAEVHAVQNLSGHADYKGILEWLSHMEKAPKLTFVTHGEPVSSEEMRLHIQKELKWNVKVPEHGQEIDL